MTQVQELARFVERTSYEGLSQEAIRELKARILDALGCAIGALEGQPVRRIREQMEEFGGNPLAGQNTSSRCWRIPQASPTGPRASNTSPAAISLDRHS